MLGYQGVQWDAEGVRVSMVGKFNDIGEVYYSENSTANILWFAAMEDAGADIRYDQKKVRSTMKVFNRKYCTVNTSNFSYF